MKHGTFSFIPIVVILMPVLLAYVQHLYDIKPILITFLQIRFVVSHARESKIQHFKLDRTFFTDQDRVLLALGSVSQTNL